MWGLEIGCPGASKASRDEMTTSLESYLHSVFAQQPRKGWSSGKHLHLKTEKTYLGLNFSHHPAGGGDSLPKRSPLDAIAGLL